MAFQLTQSWDKLKILPGQETAETGPIYNVEVFTNVADCTELSASSFVAVVIKA